MKKKIKYFLAGATVAATGIVAFNCLDKDKSDISNPVDTVVMKIDNVNSETATNDATIKKESLNELIDSSNGIESIENAEDTDNVKNDVSIVEIDTDNIQEKEDKGYVENVSSVYDNNDVENANKTDKFSSCITNTSKENKEHEIMSGDNIKTENIAEDSDDIEIETDVEKLSYKTNDTVSDKKQGKQENSKNIITTYSDEIIFNHMEDTYSDNTGLLGTGEEGQVENTKGNYVKWIDRIDVPDYAVDFYNTLAKASDGDGTDDYLIDVTDAEFQSQNNWYYIEAATISGTVAISEFNDECDKNFSDATKYIRAAFDAFDRDYPEVFWLSGSSSAAYSVSRYMSGDNYVYTQHIYFLLKTDSFDIRQNGYTDSQTIMTDIENREFYIKNILQSAPEDTYERIKYFNDWIIKNNQFNTSSSLSQSEYALAWECLSALKGTTGNKGPVCEGYSRAFKILCDRSNIQCVLVDGVAAGGGHMWNNVKLSGKWYATDVAWNDPVETSTTNAVSGYENELYLLIGSDTVISGSKFAQSHITENIASVNGASFMNEPKICKEKYIYNENADKIALTVYSDKEIKLNGKSIISGSGNNIEVGKNITLSLDNTDGFVCWVNEYGNILSNNSTYTFTAAGDMTIKAVFEKVEENKATLIYESTFGQILYRELVGETEVDSIEMPVAPHRMGYTFIGWALTKDEIKNKIKNGETKITVVPLYEKDTTIINVSVNGGQGSGEYEINSVVKIVADEPLAGKQFSHWIDENSKIVSYNSTYEFFAAKNVTLTVIYEDVNVEIEKTAITKITDVIVEAEDNKLVFSAFSSIPEGGKILQSGVIATKDTLVGTSVNDFTVDNAMKVRADEWNGNEYRYTWTVITTSKYYVRAYLVYEDIDGTIYTVYGDEIYSASVADGVKMEN